ncbi:g8482 [Coccomyxa elongata]
MPPTEPTQQNGHNALSSLQDSVYGTMAHTQGAKYQIPRKVPLRIEPKTYFANERTFLGWLSMAVTIGSVSAALVGFTASEEQGSSGPITQKTTNLITVLLLPVAILMIAYALGTFCMRSVYLQKKQMGFYLDWIGPTVLCALVMTVLTTIMVVAFVEIFSYH